MKLRSVKLKKCEVKKCDVKETKCEVKEAKISNHASKEGSINMHTSSGQEKGTTSAPNMTFFLP